MAGENWKEAHSLVDEQLRKLEADPFGFDFFRALRLLENRFRWFPRIGCTIAARHDPVRMGQKSDLSFETSTIESFEPAEDGRPPRMNVRFMGLLGPNGPMPLQFTEYTRDRARNIRDTTLEGFFNIFHHRMLSFFYRAWAINQKAVDFDRPEESKFSGYIGSFLGLGDSSLRSRDSVPDDAKFFYAGHLSTHTRHSEGLESILAGYFQVRARLEPLVGHWQHIPSRYYCRLGGDRSNATLGENAVVGEKIWNVQDRFRLVLGPLNFRMFQRFLPHELGFRRVCDWVTFYASRQFHWDVQLVLDRHEVPATVLDGTAMLGWTSWIKSGAELPADAADLVLDETALPTENHHQSTYRP